MGGPPLRLHRYLHKHYITPTRPRPQFQFPRPSFLAPLLHHRNSLVDSFALWAAFDQSEASQEAEYWKDEADSVTRRIMAAINGGASGATPAQAHPIRTATVERVTNETQIQCTLSLDTNSQYAPQTIDVKTGIGFLDHVSVLWHVSLRLPSFCRDLAFTEKCAYRPDLIRS